MSRTDKDAPRRLNDKTHQDNYLIGKSRGEAKVRKHLKRETARGARHNWVDNKEYRKLTWKTINFQVWLY